jgi:hypothetical protein
MRDIRIHGVFLYPSDADSTQVYVAEVGKA